MFSSVRCLFRSCLKMRKEPDPPLWRYDSAEVLVVTLQGRRLQQFLCRGSCTWWFIPLSKWVITPIISGFTLLIPFITGVINHLLSGMSHQDTSKKSWIFDGCAKIGTGSTSIILLHSTSERRGLDLGFWWIFQVFESKIKMETEFCRRILGSDQLNIGKWGKQDSVSP